VAIEIRSVSTKSVNYNLFVIFDCAVKFIYGLRRFATGDGRQETRGESTRYLRISEFFPQFCVMGEKHKNLNFHNKTEDCTYKRG
jgi:hypothetical protein